MIITQTFTMARWQIVVKPSEATKPTKTKMNFFFFFLNVKKNGEFADVVVVYLFFCILG